MQAYLESPLLVDTISTKNHIIFWFKLLFPLLNNLLKKTYLSFHIYDFYTMFRYIYFHFIIFSADDW